jgi:hypothetical protein
LARDRLGWPLSQHEHFIRRAAQLIIKSLAATHFCLFARVDLLLASSAASAASILEIEAKSHHHPQKCFAASPQYVSPNADEI